MRLPNDFHNGRRPFRLRRPAIGTGGRTNDKQKRSDVWNAKGSENQVNRETTRRGGPVTTHKTATNAERPLVAKTIRPFNEKTV